MKQRFTQFFARRTAALWLLGVIPPLLIPSLARADGVLYYDFAGGLAKYLDDARFFGTGASGSTSLGYSVNNGVFISLGGTTRLFSIQFGLQDRWTGASDTGLTYTLNTAYPMVRLQFGRLFVGGGYTPLVWGHTSATAGYTMVQGTSAMIGEGGLLLPVTPKFSLGAEASVQMISVAGVRSPIILDATVSMRFYFGYFGGKGSASSSEFTGWRYPYGNLR